MTRVGVVGVGLIGGSLGLSLRRVRRSGRRSFEVAGFGPSSASLTLARRRGALDRFSIHPAVLRDADVVVLAVPVQSMAAVARRILPHLKRGAVLTDTGSVKSAVGKSLRPLLRSRPDVAFVGGHPLAGSERSGVLNADANLFQNAPVVLSPAGPRGLSAVRSLWKAVGARPVVLSAAEHDRWLAATSHLPHLLSYALFSTVLSELRGRSALRALVAGSFRDMTRVAASDPDLWAAILQMNRGALLRIEKRFRRELKTLLSSSGAPLAARLSRLASAKRRW